MDIRELVADISLTDIRLIQNEAALKLDSSPDAGLSALGDIVASGEIAIQLNPVSWGTSIETWFRASVENEQFALAVAFAVIYKRQSSEAIPEDVKIEFLEKVSAMAAYPYLRAQIQRVASELRIGNVLLGVLKQGQFSVESLDSEYNKTGSESAEQEH